eukprot:s528_g20.t3
MTFEQSEQGWLKSLTDGMLLFQQLNGASWREPKVASTGRLGHWAIRLKAKNLWKPFFFHWHSATARGQRELLMDRTASAESTGSTSSPFAAGTTGVKVVASTWARDSHDLFDFEASQLQTKYFNVPSSAKFVRSGVDVQMLTDHENTPAGGEPMLRLVQREGCYWVDKATPASSSKKLWVVVRDLASSGHKLSEGDVIKLGRFKFKVRQMVASETSTVQPELHLDDTTGHTCDIETDHENKLAHTSCRICLLEGSSEDDPLIRPCQCKGSIEYVHLGCLRHWVKGRLNIADTPEGSYFYRPLPCELCKTAYPASVSKGQEKMPLVEVPKTMPPYIDHFDLEVTTSSQPSIEGINAYYEAVLAYKPFPAWSSAAEKAMEDPTCPMARVLAADCAFCQGDAARAKELLEQLVDDKESQDRLEDAERFLKERSSTWSKEALHPFLYTHCWWHLALLHCERGNFDEGEWGAIKSMPQERLWPDGPAGLEQGKDPQVQLNALNLWLGFALSQLWRLELRQDGHFLPRWQRVLEGPLQHSDLLLDILLIRGLCIDAKQDQWTWPKGPVPAVVMRMELLHAMSLTSFVLICQILPTLQKSVLRPGKESGPCSHNGAASAEAWSSEAYCLRQSKAQWFAASPSETSDLSAQVLENMMRDSQQHSSRGLHVVSLAETKLLKLGRGHESNVRIADVSISRLHATIRYQKGSFVLEDHNSKFGTLVAMKKPRQLDHGSAISIQVGRTVLSLSLQSEPAGPVNSPVTTDGEIPTPATKVQNHHICSSYEVILVKRSSWSELCRCYEKDKHNLSLERVSFLTERTGNARESMFGLNHKEQTEETQLDHSLDYQNYRPPGGHAWPRFLGAHFLLRKQVATPEDIAKNLLATSGSHNGMLRFASWWQCFAFPQHVCLEPRRRLSRLSRRATRAGPQGSSLRGQAVVKKCQLTGANFSPSKGIRTGGRSGRSGRQQNAIQQQGQALELHAGPLVDFILKQCGAFCVKVFGSCLRYC